MMKEYLRDKDEFGKKIVGGLQPLEINMNRAKLQQLGILKNVTRFPKQ